MEMMCCMSKITIPKGGLKLLRRRASLRDNNNTHSEQSTLLLNGLTEPFFGSIFIHFKIIEKTK